jgi:hypothetical protein
VLTTPPRACHYKATHRAVKLVPDCAELAHFHFVLLYDAASDSCAYEDDIAGCERGLGIERTPAAPL